MRILFLPVAVFACVLSLFQSSRAVEDELKLTVNAGEHDRRNTPVCLLVDAIRPVEVVAGDGEAAIHEMRGRGAVPVTLEQLAD